MSKRDDIIDAAEQMVRSGGYQGFSFREIAAQIGIKSASVHYYFPTKADLASTVAERYAERFMSALGTPGPAGKSKMTEAFRQSLRQDELMCLCGILGAESDSLPDSVLHPVRRFFDHLVDWLSSGLSGDDRQTQARRHVALLEGAMLMARSSRNPDLFDEITADL